MAHSLAGTRIRQKRRALKITQTALAASAGISPSYLNLIEHNRRGVAGRVLLGLARALKVSPGDLSDGAEDALLGELREVAAHLPAHDPEISGIEDLVGRFPGWSRTLASLKRQNLDQEAVIAALSDRLTHDPFLRESLHLMLSSITAIYSTANILDTVKDVPEDQQHRFHANIHTESRRLSEAAAQLTDYFDQAPDESIASATPEEELDRFLTRNKYQFVSLDKVAGSIESPDDITSKKRVTDAIETILANSDEVRRRQALTLARAILLQYANDADKMPLSAFADAASASFYDPSILAATFGCDMHAVFRRLATLRRPGIDAPAMGLIIVNAAGQALYRKPLADFTLPRHGSACPLWPVFQSFSAPSVTSSRMIELPDGRRFAALSVAKSTDRTTFDEVPLYHSAMLVVPADMLPALPWLNAALLPVQKIGLNCRICPRTNCSARSEPLILPTRDPT